jgi:LPS sulfotransferase NodH
LTVRPVLLLSVPRAGSTLVQRVLAAHPEVATESEPWFLLPLAYSLREKGARAEYWHPLAAQATNDLAQALPGGRDEYLAEIGELAMRVYSRLAGDAEVFVDKAPRYHLIADDLPRMLPDARFVFLWRNPLAVAASLLRTFRAGRFEPHLFAVDLEEGMVNLTAMWERLKGSGSAIAVRYEDLLAGPQEWQRLFEGIGLDFDPAVLEEFSEVELKGRYGDPTGVHRYRRLSREPKTKWVREFGGPVRREWADRYLARIGRRRLAAMGYDADALARDLREGPRRRLSAPADAAMLTWSLLAHTGHKLTVRAPDSPRPVN